MKKMNIILLLFSLFTIVLFSELKEYNGTGTIIFQKYGCPEFPEGSTCASYNFISGTEKFIIDISSWSLIRTEKIKSGDKVKINGCIQDDENQNKAINIIKITKIYDNKETL